MAILNNSNAISAGGYDVNNSLRIRGSVSAYLNRTPGTAGNRKTWTWSAWIKLGTISTTAQTLFAAQGQTAIYINDGTYSNLRVNGVAGGDTATTALFRDPSAWYHIVVAVDTTQATASNRLKMYVNGVQYTNYVYNTDPTLNGDSFVNSTALHTIGRRSWNSDQQFDGYIAEQYLIDGSAKTPSDFGETDATTGVWKPKAYTGTYGTNGFYLKFSDIATTSGSNAGLGKDFSGNTNYWTTNNISVTSGTTYDAMKDSPTNTSATTANYCTLNSTIKISSGSITEGNLKGAGSDFEGWGTIAFPSTGKFYFEYTQNGSTGAGAGPGTGMQGINPPDLDYGVRYHKDGRKWVNGTYSTYGATFTTNDIIGVAYDAGANSITFYKNNVSQGAISTTSGYTYLPYQFDNSGNGGFLNFGQRPFSYTPPTGFVALNTYNLPDSTIKKGSSYMDAILYTGNGANGRAITTGMATDLAWIKKRSGADNHELQDRVRGAAKRLQSNSNAAEVAISAVASFTSTGFTVDGWGTTNENGFTYVAWSWLANGSGSTNTSGSITSTVSVNTTAGFSIVTYTGSGAAGTVGHGLGVAPAMIITKNRTTSGNSWVTWQKAMSNAYSSTTAYMYLDQTAAVGTTTNFYDGTAMTSSTFRWQTGNINVNSTSNNYVSYCWAEIAGFSRFGSYTGNGSTDGPFIYLGFRPKFILAKRTDTAGFDWIMTDSSRSPSNVVDKRLFGNTNDAESSATTPYDYLSNGFKLRNTNANENASGGTYIYMAFAENPFKNANAR